MDILSKYNKYMVTEILAAPPPIAVESAEGATITDPTGRTYIDAFAGISVVNAGHGNKAILEAAREQLGRLVHCCTYLYAHRPAADLAELLAKVVPGGLSKSFFTNSGAEANEAAIRLAKQFTGRSEFIALHGSFHGRTLATLSLSGMSSRKRGNGPYMPGVAFAPAPYCYRCALRLKPRTCGLACAETLDLIIRCATSGAVAALIAEPVQGEGGIVVPPGGYFRTVAEILRRHEVLLIMDEVQTGFGRTGYMFATQATGVKPDIMTLGKGIANGLPLGAMITRPEIAAAFKPGDHLSTFGGNPVSCAAAIATLNFHRRRRLAQAARRKGQWLMAELRRRLRGERRVGEIRGRGLMVGIELVKDKAGTPAPDFARRIVAACRQRGVLVGIGGVYGNVLRIQPPLVIGEDQLEQVASVAAGAIKR